MRKSYTLALIAILAISNLIMVKPSFASTPTVSTPEFTLKLVDNSYDTPAKTTIDPYTGENITRPSSHVENKAIVLSIKNQPYDQNYAFFYDIRMKGHFEKEWTGLLYPYTEHPLSSFTSQVWNIPADFRYEPLQPSNSEHTVVSYGDYQSDFQVTRLYPSNGQVDFSVRALLYNATYPAAGDRYESTLYTLIVASDWSDTQTINITDGSVASNVLSSLFPSSVPTVTPVPSGSQTVSSLGLSWIDVATVALLGVIAVLLVVVVVFLKKRGAP